MEFKEYLKDFLSERNLSQFQFAKSIDTTQGTISKWLSGVQEPRLIQLQKMCKVYDIDANVLLGIKEY